MTEMIQHSPFPRSMSLAQQWTQKSSQANGHQGRYILELYAKQTFQYLLNLNPGARNPTHCCQ